jgi:hypothetical protein
MSFKGELNTIDYTLGATTRNSKVIKASQER